MKPAERKTVLAFVHTVAVCAMRAAIHTGNNRACEELRDIVAKQERQHRALGRRMVGDIGARMTIEQTCDYFVARCLAEGLEKKHTSQLDGLRADYVIGAIMMSNARFVADFRSRLAVAFPGESFGEVLARCEAADYCDLIAKGAA